MSDDNWILTTEKLPKTFPVLCYSPEFIDDDFNPLGIREGHYTDSVGWTTVEWFDHQDCYNTDITKVPTHWKKCIPPEKSE